MDKETIVKVLELTEEKYRADRDYRLMKQVITDLYKQSDSKYAMVNSFFINLREGAILSRLSDEDIDDFYSQVFVTIEKAWNQICNKHLAIVEHIDKELEAL